MERLKSRCTALITEAEHELLDAKGLLQALRESSPVRAGVIERFLDSELPLAEVEIIAVLKAHSGLYLSAMADSRMIVPDAIINGISRRLITHLSATIQPLF